MDKEKLIPYIVQLVILFISYQLGRFQMKNKYILDKLEERYSKAYVPYVTKLYDFYWSNLSPLHNYNYYNRYVLYFSQNLQYFDHGVVEKYCKFYELFCETYYSPWHNTNRDEDMRGHLLIAFEHLNSAILKEALKISNELKLPPLAKALMDKRWPR